MEYTTPAESSVCLVFNRYIEGVVGIVDDGVRHRPFCLGYAGVSNVDQASLVFFQSFLFSVLLEYTSLLMFCCICMD